MLPEGFPFHQFNLNLASPTLQTIVKHQWFDQTFKEPIVLSNYLSSAHLITQ